MELIDQAIVIPQQGMVQSLNISVACAVTLYELMRQRLEGGMYANDPDDPKRKELFDRYVREHKKKNFGRVKLWE